MGPDDLVDPSVDVGAGRLGDGGISPTWASLLSSLFVSAAVAVLGSHILEGFAELGGLRESGMAERRYGSSDAAARVTKWICYTVECVGCSMQDIPEEGFD